MGTYDCEDGQIMLVVGNDRQYERFCEAIGRPDLFADERFGSIAGRLNHREILEAEVIAELRKRPRAFAKLSNYLCFQNFPMI